MPKEKPAPDPAALKRTAAGRYETGDGRFTIEQESAGSWALVDAEQTNELGLPLVRGPFATLAAAKDALASAREAPAPPSPLERRLKEAKPPRPARSGDRHRQARPSTSSTEEPPPRLEARQARPGDAAAIVRIYNAGIESHEATFETEPRSRGDILGWLDGRHPVVVVTRGDDVLGFAATFEYRSRSAYVCVAEFSVYADPDHRREGAGRLAMESLIEAATEAGFWKLVSRVFIENEGSRKLLRSVGFREVGTYRRHARLDGQWRDCVIVERLLGEALED
ncbi:MAG TPA: arsinothricin resistance N-acetyltransferase ArsN1 family A [Candidatus Limnocylindrales bacterium]